MPRLTCPECDEVVKVPDGAKASVRCTGCGLKLSDGSPVDEAEEPKPRARAARRKKVSGDRRIRGLIPLLILGPIGIATAVAAPFSSLGTQLAIYSGFAIWILALVMIWRMYGGAEAGEGEAVGIAIMIDAIGKAFHQPRLLGSWVFLLVLGLTLIFEGIFVAVVFKTLQEKPPNPAPGAPGNPQPQAGPNPPVAPPNNPPGPVVSEADRLINQALSDLDKGDAFARKGASLRLTEMKPKPDRQVEVVKMLNERLDDKEVLSRTQIILALGVWGGPNDVPALVQLLDDPEPFTRESAVRAVTRFRDPRAIPGLIRCLKVPFPRDPVQALVEIGPAVEKELIQELSNKDSESLEGAIEVLKKIGTRASIPALRALVNDPKKQHAPSAQEAIKSINERTKKDPKK